MSMSPQVNARGTPNVPIDMDGLARFLEPPRLRTLEADAEAERHATWLELFLDLVFVVAIAELGTSLAHEPTAAGFLRYLGLLVPIWWAWAGFTFYATRFDTDDLIYRVGVLAGMFGVAALASRVPQAFHGHGNSFVIAYIAIRSVIVLLYVRAHRHVERARPLATWFIFMFSIAIVVWAISLALPSPWRYVLWAVALALELGAPPRAWRLIRNAPIDPAHIPERFGLLTIIVLGEAVIAVVLGTVNVSWTLGTGSTALAGFLAAAAIWWIYFEFFDATVVTRGVFRGLVFVYSHYFVAAGIAAAGVGVRLVVHAAGPDTRYEHIGWLPAAGVALCMLAVGVIQLATPPTMLDVDVALRFATAIFAGVLALLADVLSPVLILWLLAAALLVQVVVELAGHDGHGHPR
jgi:low temperature requirement protein LtrA